MTTYTKTQLIDMAIDKLGNSPDWDVYGFVSVSTIENTTYGFGEFDICHERHINGKYWQLVCTQEEFERRARELEVTTKPNSEWWDYENGKTLSFPPAGTKCEVYTDQWSKWYKTVIIGVDSKGRCVYEETSPTWNDGEDYSATDNLSWFRPLPIKPVLTERQQAGLKLWRAINYNDPMTDDEVLGYCRFEDYCKPWDLGMLK